MSADRTGLVDAHLYFLHAAALDDADPAILGNKAANLVRIASAGLPVPPGFVLGTQVCADYHARGGRLQEDLPALIGRGIQHIERSTGRRFGAPRRPLLVAVRSGAAVSMPGMLDTVLNVGLCDSTIPGLLRATGDPVFVWDTYRRLVQSYAEVVGGCPPASFAAVVDEAMRRHDAPTVAELDAAALRDVTSQLQETYRSVTNQPFPQDPNRQLLAAIEAVLRSWNAPRAAEYRRLEGLPDLAGTAVTVQAMVFGNMGLNSGSGVGFTRDPATGEHRLYVDFALDAQGEDIVAGRHRAGESESLLAIIPGLVDELQTVGHTLEALLGDAQDFEFTVEDAKLWLLQTRTAKRTPWAALQIACDLVAEGLVDRTTALQRLSGYDLDSISRFRLDPEADVEPIGTATPASAGVASGRIALDVAAARRQADQGESVILVRHETSTDDIAGLAVCRGLLTATGARTSHAAVVARQRGVVCLINCPSLVINAATRTLHIGDHRLHEDAMITLDSTQGHIYADAVPVIEERPKDLIAAVRAWEPAHP